ncbi:MAG: penicillin-binding protein activator LpoB [Deltaproteobacteria bacterium]|nr:penicillin-binding protein activator LpoB [Deltaproteobacteria bacterium]
MKRCSGICLLGLLFLLVSVISGWAGPRIAVMDFKNQTPHGGWRLGSGAADILTTELVKTGKFDMFERERLSTVIKEQNLGTSGRVDTTSAARIGKIIGVNYIITGAVTEYGQSRSGGGGGGVNVGKVGYHSAVDIRMVDATTGRIVFADTASHSKSSVKVRIFGFGGGESFNEKLATETMREAIRKVAAKMDITEFKTSGSRKPAAASAKASGKAVIADVDGKTITLNKGKSAGFKMGQTVTISRKGKVIKDPTTGKVLKIKYKTIGKIKLTEVEQAYSEGIVISGSGFIVGDIIR